MLQAKSLLERRLWALACHLAYFNFHVAVDIFTNYETEGLESLFGGLLLEIRAQCFSLCMKGGEESWSAGEFNHDAMFRTWLSCDYSFIAE